MIFSRRCGFVFVHTPKTAGTSIMMALRRHHDLEDVVGTKHETLAELATRRGDLQFGELFTFCFVRDPRDRMLSLYRYLKKTRPASALPHIDRIEGFEDFVSEIAGRSAWLERLYSMRPQVDYAKGCAFVGRYERLASDYAKVCRRLGLADKLPHLNSTKNAARESCSSAARQLINARFAEDLEAFGYAP